MFGVASIETGHKLRKQYEKEKLKTETKEKIITEGSEGNCL
jgi:hypothetical protein